MREGFKPDDVEEPIDRWLHRPLADQLIVGPLLPITFVSPNHLTVASGATSLAAGVSWALHQPKVGAVLLFASILLDCADGQLARRRGATSAFGRALDGVMDGVAPTAVLIGMALHLGTVWAWLGAAAGGVSLAWHAASYDALKNVYLGATRPDIPLGGDAVLDADGLAAEARDHFRGRRFVSAALFAIWARWTRRQRRWLRGWDDGAFAWPRSDHERTLAVTHLRTPMRAARWLGFGLHMFLLSAAGLVDPPYGPLVAWGAIAGPLNVWAYLVGRRWRQAEAAYLTALRSARG